MTPEAEKLVTQILAEIKANPEYANFITGKSDLYLSNYIYNCVREQVLKSLEPHVKAAEELRDTLALTELVVGLAKAQLNE